MTKNVLLLLLNGVILSAQTRGAETVLVGTITDPSGAAVTSARVVLRATGGELETATDGSGEFRFVLAPGNYELQTTVTGFEPVVRKVGVGTRSPQRLTIQLALAALKEQLDVPEHDQSVSSDTANNADRISVERTMLDNLPFLDNNYLSALGRFLDPGTPGAADFHHRGWYGDAQRRCHGFGDSGDPHQQQPVHG